MMRAKVFRSGNSQAVRLPRELQLAASEVYIKKVGAALVLVPVADAWATLEASLSMFSDDFMSRREQPPVRPREHL